MVEGGQRNATEVVLIVEDSQLLLRNLQRIAEAVFPNAVRTSSSYEDAIAVLEELEWAPIALILDVNLGSTRGDGLDIGEDAHARFHRHIPTLVLTGSHALAEISERALRLRAELLVKPQGPEAVRMFLERAAVRSSWGAADLFDLDHELQRFATTHRLTQPQQRLLFTLLRAMERGERPDVNANTRKAGLRRILRRTGYATFEELRYAIKHLTM